MHSRHLSRVIHRSAEEAYAFVANPDNLVRWAAGLAQGDAIRKGPDLIVDSPMGLVTVRIAPCNDYGVFDHDVTLPSGLVVTNPARILPHAEGCEVLFTLRQLDMTDEEFERDTLTVEEDLERLAALLDADQLPAADPDEAVESDLEDEPIQIPIPPGTLDPAKVDLENLIAALQQQDNYDMSWFLDPQTGELHFWTIDTGLDDDRTTDREDAELRGLLEVETLPSRVFYLHMVEFTETLPHGRAKEALEIALDGKGAFRRFNDALHQRFPELLPDWRAFRAGRERETAVEWLVDEGVVDPEAGRAFSAQRPHPVRR